MADLYKTADGAAVIVREFHQSMSVLIQDVDAHHKQHRCKPRLQVWRRALVRALFALIEANVYGMKRVAIVNNDFYAVDFSPAELAMLREEKYELKENGTATAKDSNFPRLLPNVRFAFAMFARSYGSSFILDTSGLPELEQLLKVRNKITHPKSAKGLEITDAACSLGTKVWKWYSQQFVSVTRDCMKNRHSPRMPEVVRTLPVSQPFVLFCADGAVFEFPTSEALFSFTKTHRSDPNISRGMAVTKTAGKPTVLKDGDFNFIK